MQPSELIKQLEAAFELRKADNFADALEEFASLERQSWHPQEINPLRVFQVMCLTDLGRIADAHRMLNSVDASYLGDVDRIDYEFEFARIAWKEGNLHEALEHTAAASKLINVVEDQSRVQAASEDLLSLQGVLLSELKRCDEAIPILEQVPEESSWWVTAKIHLGECRIWKRSHREAIMCYLNILSSSREIDPIDRMTAIRNIGCAYFYAGEYSQAVEYLTQVEDGYEEHPDLKAELFGMLASAYLHLGMRRESAKYSGWAIGVNRLQ
jgi:tetratricopeptide (TPR) repeat protein